MASEAAQHHSRGESKSSPAGDAIPRTREGWESRLRELAKRARAADWELGDLLAFGESEYGVTYKEMAE